MTEERDCQLATPASYQESDGTYEVEYSRTTRGLPEAAEIAEALMGLRKGMVWEVNDIDILTGLVAALESIGHTYNIEKVRVGEDGKLTYSYWAVRLTNRDVKTNTSETIEKLEKLEVNSGDVVVVKYGDDWTTEEVTGFAEEIVSALRGTGREGCMVYSIPVNGDLKVLDIKDGDLCVLSMSGDIPNNLLEDFQRMLTEAKENLAMTGRHVEFIVMHDANADVTVGDIEMMHKRGWIRDNA